jgi:hypothetical protein
MLCQCETGQCVTLVIVRVTHRHVADKAKTHERVPGSSGYSDRSMLHSTELANMNRAVAMQVCGQLVGPPGVLFAHLLTELQANATRSNSWQH